MKRFTTILCTLALLFGVVGGVNSVKAEKVPGTEYTSLLQLSGKTFAIINKADGKAIYHRASPSPFTLGYDNYGTAFAADHYLFKIEEIDDDTDPAADGKYLICCVNEDGSNYDNNYFQTNSDECFIYALTFGSGRGLDGTNTAVWDIEYVAEKGWTLKNVGKGGYYNDPTKGATDETPGYFTFCEVNGIVDQNVEITVGGDTRNYQLYVPDNAEDNCPLVISLHGAGGHSTDYSPFRKDVADLEGCIVAYPQGKDIYFPFFGGTVPGWDASGEVNEDVEFLKAVIEDVASKYQIDRNRIYCCGFSNGGMMTYAMANACSDEIAAFASISGYPLNEFHLRHTGERPVPFLHIHGKEDDFVPYEKMPTIVDEMVARLGANPVPITTSGSGYTKNVYAAADGSFPYIYYAIDGMGHNDFTDKTEDGSSAKTMWNFFEQYTLDSPCDKTQKWAPRIDEDGYNPAEHGWTKNSGTTLLRFGGDQKTDGNQNVYHSLQFNNGNYMLSFTSTGAAGKTIGVTIEKLTSPYTAVLNTTVDAGADAELPFSITDGWGEYKLTMTRPEAGDAITITNIVIGEETLEISNTAEWESFATRVANGEHSLNAVLTTDVDAGSTMVGNESHKYSGTFNGAGHTLTFNYDGNSSMVAPFKEVDGATITDLKTTGSITSTANLLGGIIGQVNGATTLTRCASDMSITTTVGDNGRIGGLVARNGQAGSSLTFNHCMYHGAINSSTNQAAGFVGWSPNSTTISNCLVAATSITGGESNFAPNSITIPDGKYALYTSKFGSSTQGTQVTDVQRYNGYVAYTLSSDITEGVLFFGQGGLNSSRVDEYPSLTSVASKKVLRTYTEETNFYSNPGGLLPDPALCSMLSWKFEMSGEAPYQTHLPAEQTTDKQLYGSPDAYNLVIGSAGASTFVFPFTTDGLPSGVKAYDLTFDGSVITATEVSKITADKPVLINAEAGTYKFESKLGWWESVNYSTHTETTNGALTGVYNTSLPFSYVPQNAYVLQNGAEGLGFYKVDEENTIKITSFRAYLTAPASARMLNIVYADNDATAINEVKDGKSVNENVYSISGQRVEKATKGLYIKNGKKVIFK